MHDKKSREAIKALVVMLGKNNQLTHQDVRFIIDKLEG